MKSLVGRHPGVGYQSIYVRQEFWLKKKINYYIKYALNNVVLSIDNANLLVVLCRMYKYTTILRESHTLEPFRSRFPLRILQVSVSEYTDAARRASSGQSGYSAYRLSIYRGKLFYYCSSRLSLQCRSQKSHNQFPN